MIASFRLFERGTSVEQARILMPEVNGANLSQAAAVYAAVLPVGKQRHSLAFRGELRSISHRGDQCSRR